MGFLLGVMTMFETSIVVNTAQLREYTEYNCAHKGWGYIDCISIRPVKNTQTSFLGLLEEMLLVMPGRKKGPVTFSHFTHPLHLRNMKVGDSAWAVILGA